MRSLFNSLQRRVRANTLGANDGRAGGTGKMISMKEKIEDEMSSLLDEERVLIEQSKKIFEKINIVRLRIYEWRAAARRIGVRIELTHPLVCETRKSVKDIVLDCMRGSGSSGIRVSQIKNMHEVSRGEMITSKAIGNALYRLSVDGLIYSIGHTWYLGSREKCSDFVKNKR